MGSQNVPTPKGAGDRIRLLRKYLNRSLKVFAKEVGIPHDRLSKLEKGINLDIDKLHKIAECFGFPTDEINPKATCWHWDTDQFLHEASKSRLSPNDGELVVPSENIKPSVPLFINNGQSAPPWLTSDHLDSTLKIGARHTLWIPIEGDGCSVYSPENLSCELESGEVHLRKGYWQLYDQICEEELAKGKAGKTNGSLLSLVRFDSRRTPDDELLDTHFVFKKTQYFRFLASSIDPRGIDLRTEDLRKWEHDHPPLADFPNGFGLCLVVHSRDNMLLLAKRTDDKDKIGPRPGEWDVSVVEGLNPKRDTDNFQKPPDLFEAARFGIEQEVGLKTQRWELRLLGFGVDMAFYQWNVIGLVMVDADADEIFEYRVRLATDRYEIKHLIGVKCNPSAVFKFVQASPMWSSGVAALYYSLINLFGPKEVDRCAKTVFGNQSSSI